MNFIYLLLLLPFFIEARRSCSTRGYVPQPPNRVNTSERVKQLRKIMGDETVLQGKAVQAVVITCYDEHMSSHPFNDLQHMSGFSGSFGVAVITMNSAAFWTDGRYYIQADEELACFWQLLRQGEKQVHQWLIEQLLQEYVNITVENGLRVGVDPMLISHDDWLLLEENLAEFNVTLTPTPTLLPSLSLPPPALKQTYVWPESFSGLSYQQKIDLVRQKLSDLKVDAIVVSALDEVGWLLNIRGRDVGVFVKAYCILSLDKVWLYVDEKKLTDDVRQYLQFKPGGTPYSVIRRPYESITIDLPIYSQQNSYILLPSSSSFSPGISHSLFTLVDKSKRFHHPSPIVELKAVKNQQEIEGMEKAAIRDSVCLVEFFATLEEEIKRGEEWHELKVIEELNIARLSQPLSKGSSFPAIVAYGTHSALPHYSATGTTNRNISQDDLLLIDSGGQYLDGTTDVTRTLHFGTPTPAHINAYTTVLQAQIALSSLIFPAHLPVSAADVAGRRYMWREGEEYEHGTGHGVGMFGNVHEGPISVAFSDNSNQTFQVGNFFSNEPGLYYPGSFGIRLENMLEVIQKFPWLMHPSGEIFLGFRDVTLVPFEPKLIDFNKLSLEQRRWLNNYNFRIRSIIGNDLKKQKKMDAFYWMMSKTKTIAEFGLINNGHSLSFSYIFMLLLFIHLLL